MNLKRFTLLAIMLAVAFDTTTAQKSRNSDDNSSTITTQNYNAFAFRNIGPAFSSGRISDIAIHPDNKHVWYVGIGSGGVWKTENSGTTWTPLFDKQSVYSIGSITIDPNNTHRIWVGTGENVGGRHVAFGDGVYLSEDGGTSWNNMGLPESEHIGKIIVHPSNSDIVMVAAQGPLWNKGGERGFYLTEDGGKTWTKTLGDDEWVGVTDIVVDPRDPNVVYAATWQRHRTVAALIDGGLGSGVHKSTDGGKTWTELKKGLPGGIKGKIGLAISPQNPDYVYAAIETIRRKGGVYTSTDRGASWKKMSDAVAGATGPHYYQELYASPHDFGTIYLVDVRMQVSLSRSTKPDIQLMKDLHDAEMTLMALDTKMNGNLPQRELRDVMPKTVMNRISVAFNGLRGTYGPTAMHQEMLEVGKEEFEVIHNEFRPLMHEIVPDLVERLKANGAPPIIGLNHD